MKLKGFVMCEYKWPRTVFCCKSFNRPKAFTLVELLVVISIIALLLSILMPSLSRARNSAQSVVCKANLKNIGLSEILFAQDNGRKIAWTRLDSTGTQGYSAIYWAAQLWATYNKVTIPGLYNTKPAAYTSPKWLMCPAEKKPEYMWGDVPRYKGSTFYDNWLNKIGYARNAYNLTIGVAGKPQGNMDQIDSPSRQANVIDGLREWNPGGNWCDLYWPGSQINPLLGQPSGWRTALYRHAGNEGINILLWDGHAESAKRTISDKFLISVKAFSR